MPSGLVWTHHPAFGVVHSSGCNVCLSYMRHVTDAAQVDVKDSSFRLAIKERDGQGSLQYLNGVSEGMRLQTLDLDVSVADFLAKYQTEREEILEMMNLRTVQLVAAEQELVQLKQQFKELQALLDDATIFSTSADLPACAESSTCHTQTVHNAGTSQEDQLKPEGNSFLPTPPQTPPSITKRTSLLPSSPNQDMASFRASTPTTNSTSPDVSQLSQSLAPDEPTWESLAVSSLQELIVLLQRARDGDEQAYMAVNAIHIAARSTPVANRKPYQQLVLLEWEPRSFPSSCNPSTPDTVENQAETTKVESSLPEIFVDSSRWGIGFVLNGRWMAWKFTPGWETDGRDNNWAEMVAVELGLLVVASAGFRSQNVVVRSDNTGVVIALQKGASKHPRQPEVLTRIKAITRSYGFNLEVRWISSEHNPADRPSRGNLPSDALRLPMINLPDQLLPFLSNLV